MAKTLRRSVTVQNPETGEYVALAAGSELPGWATKLVTNAKAFKEPEPGEIPKALGAVKGLEKLAAANAPAEPAPEAYPDGTVRVERTAAPVPAAEADSEGDEDSGENEGAEPPAPTGARAKEAPARKQG